MESTASESPSKYFCHICNLTITQTSTDYLCPHCNQGFIEKLSDSSASSSYTDRNSENDDEFRDIPTVLGTFFNTLGQRDLSNRVQELEVMLRGQEDNVQNPTERGATSSNPRDASTSGRQTNRRRGRADPRNLNPERILTEFFNMSRNYADTGQIFLVSNPGDYAWGREGLDTIVTQLLNQMDSSGPPPLASDKIQELPFFKITEEQVSENVQCSVCWDSFRMSDCVRQLPCEHIYHDLCIVPWLQLHGTCPICRKLLSEESESRLGGFAPGGGLEALLSDVQRRLSYTRRRCYRCNDYGHLARQCFVRGNRRNGNRGQSNHNRNNSRGGWGSNSYDTEWLSATNTNRNANTWQPNTRDEVWGAASAPAQTNSWPARENFVVGDYSAASNGQTADNNDGWGAVGWTTSDVQWPTGGETTSFELCLSVSEDDDDDEDPEWFGFDEEYFSDVYSSDEEGWPSVGYDSFTNGSSSSVTYGNNSNTASNWNFGGRNPRKCYNCGEPGHLARACPQRYQSRSSDHARARPRCEVCGKWGHESSVCWHASNTASASRNSGHQRLRSAASSVRNRPPTPHRSGSTNYQNDSGNRSARSGYRGRWFNNSSNQGAGSYPNSGAPSTSRQSFHRNIVCWNCNETGHVARDCPEHRCCNVCQSIGHRNGECQEFVES